MKYLLPMLCWLLPCIALAQVRDSLVRELSTQSQPASKQKDKPEIFTSGFIDVINNGQVNASARFIRLNVGEPGKFVIPLSLYSGVSSNNFQNTQISPQHSNDGLTTNFINPLSGLANLSIENIIFFKSTVVKITRSGILYHFGERVLTGVRTGQVTDPRTGSPVNFLNSFGSLGLYFQTGAWERNNAKNVGVAWFAVRYIGCHTNPNQLKEIMPDIQTNGFYLGYSLSWGVEINGVVNIKVIYYKYTKKPEINYSFPIYQFSFNYTMKN